MHKFLFIVLLSLAAFTLWFACQEARDPSAPTAESTDMENLDKLSDEEIDQYQSFAKGGSFGHIVVANRGSGSISIINARTDTVEKTINLPAGTNPPEPMYVVWQPFAHRVFVGDRANDRVVVYDDRDYSVEATVPAGAGVFHMWADFREKQLWVVNDIDNAVTVIDPHSLNPIATVAIPGDLAAMGGKPHDVILSPAGFFAYVSIVGIGGDEDYVVQYSTYTFQEIGRAAVGKDPHLSVTIRNPFLYVPCQNSDAVFVLNRFSMNLVTTIAVPGAHGAGMPLLGRTFYTSNLPGGGANGLFAIDTRSNTVIGSVDTPFAVPHNIALTLLARKLYLTHSGPTADKVTVYKISRHNPVPVFQKEITVGLNPFGLAFSR